MTELMTAIIVRAFDSPDEVREFEKGRFEIVRLGGSVIGRAAYEPGWQWSLHVGPSAKESRCKVEHLGYVLSGICAVKFDDGEVTQLPPRGVFYIPARPHDSWVVGAEPYVSLHFMGASDYAT